MFDLKSPSGLLFTAKQNLLSRVAPKTEASKGIGYAGGALNEGVYTPLSTLAQAGVGFAGIHLNKQGLDPTGLIDALSIKKYEEVIKSQDENRLVTLSLYSLKNFNKIKGYDLNQGQDIITYDGGPGSTLGIGKTHIRYADQRTGVNNPLSDSDPKYFYKGGVKLHKEEEQNIILGTDETGRSIITYGLVGITTAVLAYATVVSNVKTTVAESAESIVGSPMAALNSMNPLSSEAKPSPESEASSSPEEPVASVVESLNPLAPKEAETTGGKKRRRKTPKLKRKRGGKSKTAKCK